MISLRHRLALCFLALLLCLSLYIKGRVPTVTGEGAAFFTSGPETVTVRLSGDFPRPGVYLLPKGASTRTAINMTLPDVPLAVQPEAAVRAQLAAGDIVTLRRGDGKSAVISITKMATRERMLLRVPLHPDLMEAQDWQLLPGIGPVLSRRIMEDRHKNGAFGSLEGVLRVPGIGPGKLELIRRYF